MLLLKHPSKQSTSRREPLPAPPPGVLLVEDFIDAELCRMFCDHADKQKAEPQMVLNYDKTTREKVESNVDLRTRDSQRILTEYLDDVQREPFFNIFANYVEPFYKLRIAWWEKPQFMRYVAGGKYGTHADAEHKVIQPDGSHRWVRTFDRDISILLYLNDAFTGGNLHFPTQNYTLRPRPGLLVAFPSTHEYLHEAQPTESGVRYVVVSWAAAVDVPRVRPEPPWGSVFMKDFR